MMSTNAIVVAILVATVAVAQSKECAKICTLEYNPICASNGGEFRLFGNPCFYEAYECETDTVWVRSRSLEPCQVKPLALSAVAETKNCEIPCTREFEPICGTNGERTKLFANRCIMANEHCNDGQAWFETRKSDCTPISGRKLSCEVPCTREMNPVCGTDGTTFKFFNNPCIMENEHCKDGHVWFQTRTSDCNQINEVPVNKKDCEIPCTRELNPVCGSNGERNQLFNNKCIMENEHCKDGREWYQSLSVNCFQAIMPLRVAENKRDCEVPCTRELKPVCGFDGEHHKLFNNECLMANEHCNDGHQWMESRMSDCLFRAPTIDTKCERPCRKNLVPTCGTDGEHYKMFSNKCIMDNEHCNDGHAWKQTRMADCGEAPEESVDNGPLSDCPLICPLIYAPVCGFDGRSYQTFANSCEMRAKNCNNHTLFKETRLGECPEL